MHRRNLAKLCSANVLESFGYPLTRLANVLLKRTGKTTSPH